MKKVLIGAMLMGALAIGGPGIAAAQSDDGSVNGLDFQVWQAQYGDASGSVVVPTFPRDRVFFTVAHFDNAANPSHAVAQIRANEDWPFAPRDDNAPYRVLFRNDGSLD
jgi:hypothetical protein